MGEGKVRLQFMLDENTFREVLKYKPPGIKTTTFLLDLIELGLSEELKN